MQTCKLLGANANTPSYIFATGDKILGMDLASGGHLSLDLQHIGKIYEVHLWCKQ